MPSHALRHWQNHRLPRLNAVESQCAALSVLVPPNPDLADESLRGYTMILSAHWQGFCRDLHTESIQIVAAALPVAMQLMMQTQCSAGRKLDGANATYESIRTDYERFGFNLGTALAADPANAVRLTHLGHLNDWRNYAAHHKSTPPRHGGPFTLVTVQMWKNTGNELAAELDRIMYNQLQSLTGAVPW